MHAMFSRDHHPPMKARQTKDERISILTTLNDVNKLILGWSGYDLGFFMNL